MGHGFASGRRDLVDHGVGGAGSVGFSLHGVHHHLRPLLREAEGVGPTEPSPSAGDDGYPSLKRAHWFPILDSSVWTRGQSVARVRRGATRSRSHVASATAWPWWSLL